jgi:hypothetical protein
VSDVTAELKSKFQRLLELRETRDIDKARAKKSEEAYREAELELYEELKDSGMRGRIGFDFGGDLGRASFNLRTTHYGRIVDKEAALKSLKASGDYDVIYTDSIREGRLNSLVNTRLETRKDLPDGVDFYTKRGITISRK